MSNSVSVPWPRGWTAIDHLGTQFESNDPNDHWRPWLESNVGRQGWDWDWRLDSRLQGNYDNVEIGFRRGRKKEMISFTLRWV